MSPRLPEGFCLAPAVLVLPSPPLSPALPLSLPVPLPLGRRRQPVLSVRVRLRRVGVFPRHCKGEHTTDYKKTIGVDFLERKIT